MIPMLQVKQLRLRKGEALVQCHTACRGDRAGTRVRHAGARPQVHHGRTMLAQGPVLALECPLPWCTLHASPAPP